MKRVVRNRQRKKRAIISLITISIIFISLSAIPSYGLFSRSDINLSYNSNKANNLNIQNGITNLNLDKASDTAWTTVFPDGNLINSSIIKDPSSNQLVSFGPVYIMTPVDSISSNVNLQIQYIVKKIGGTKENANTAVGITTAEPFEVIVGDMDNFNIGVPTAYDFYSGETTAEHSIDVFPKSYDANGTDRRMVPSGFYELGKKIFTKVNSSNEDAGLKLPSINAICNAYNNTAFYGATLNSNITMDSGITIPKNIIVYYDGYSDRGIAGTNVSNQQAADCMMDGVNWRYLQKSRPIIFKYDTILKEEGINSVNFQIFTDDIQSGIAVNPTEFAEVSGSYFRVYILDGNNKVEVPEFAAIINKYAQSGPVGNIISLNLPEEYFKYIRNASGLNKGLSLLIDDERVGISGDSFAIDFAKMTVNKEAAKGANNSITIKGKVIDSKGDPILGVKVATGDGKSALTGADGKYTISGAAPGLLSLTYTHYEYKTEVFMYGNATKGQVIDLQSNSSKWQTLYRGLKEEIDGREKLKVIATIQKCNLDGTVIEDESPIELNSGDLNETMDYEIRNIGGDGTIINQSAKLTNLAPGSRYKITYKLILKSYEDIGDLDAFKINFSSRIKARITQENNPAWGETALEKDYETSFKEPDLSEILDPQYSDNINQSTESRIYFERPDTENYWSDFTTGPLPSFYLNSNTPLSGGNISKILTGSNWYKYTFDSTNAIPENSYVKVTDGSRSSGRLYYFSTQKIFICTN